MRTLLTSALRIAGIVLFLGATSAALPQEVILGMTTAPVPIKRANPEYTPEARVAKLEGNVVVSAVVGVDGVPTEIKVIRGLGMGLDEKAIENVSRWRFKPGMRDGEPVAVKVNFEIAFRLSQPDSTTAR